MQILIWVFEVALVCSVFPFPPLSLAQTISQAPPVCSGADRAALLAFKAKIVKDTTESLSSWTGTDCCGGDWEGVECNPAGRVTTLALQSPARDGALYMKGTLSSSLGSLPFLEVLVISGMKLISGPIPDSFSKLTRLTQLVLEDNSLQGYIPLSLGRLSYLQTLSLAGNRLKGTVPPGLGNLRNLVMMNLGRNLLSGPIPSSFKTLLRLQSFDLSFNSFSGSIPEFIGQFRNITFIDISNNRVSDHLPISMFNLVSLSYLSLSHNQLTGTIPDQIGNLKSLTSISLSSNKFIGHIPASISRLQNLWHLNLSRNGFTGPLPDVSSGGIPSLLSIDLSFNNLSLGTVPNWITDRQLSDVNLAGCKLKGSLPKFTRPDSLNSIDLSNNFFTGGISSFLSSMTSLQKLKLSNNQLKFDLSELKVPDGISSIDLHSNSVIGSLSVILNNRTSSFLEVIDVSNNLISGTIPEFTKGLNFKSVEYREQPDCREDTKFNLESGRTRKAGCFEEPDNWNHTDKFRTIGGASLARCFHQQAHWKDPSKLVGH
ncbi:high mobility group B protein 7-like [Hibiscus syriacus]|uniref:High mobility group B protein 7-like n=1 Tax=Hibiscus syriacus TaxID=106335 RepID=A0A6A2YI80_HIBSY|nr:high mobility group B protein 7-like [Hibiscus syriacus]